MRGNKMENIGRKRLFPVLLLILILWRGFEVEGSCQTHAPFEIDFRRVPEREVGGKGKQKRGAGDSFRS